MEQAHATYTQTIARMKRGDMPKLTGGYIMNAWFSDGTQVKREVMIRIRKEGIATYGKDGVWYLCEA